MRRCGARALSEHHERRTDRQSTTRGARVRQSTTAAGPVKHHEGRAAVQCLCDDRAGTGPTPPAAPGLTRHSRTLASVSTQASRPGFGHPAQPVLAGPPPAPSQDRSAAHTLPNKPSRPHTHTHNTTPGARQILHRQRAIPGSSTRPHINHPPRTGVIIVSSSSAAPGMRRKECPRRNAVFETERPATGHAARLLCRTAVNSTGMR